LSSAPSLRSSAMRKSGSITRSMRLWHFSAMSARPAQTTGIDKTSKRQQVANACPASPCQGRRRRYAGKVSLHATDIGPHAHKPRSPCLVRYSRVVFSQCGLGKVVFSQCDFIRQLAAMCNSRRVAARQHSRQTCPMSSTRSASSWL
jgi:hypothetical protein